MNRKQNETHRWATRNTTIALAGLLDDFILPRPPHFIHCKPYTKSPEEKQQFWLTRIDDLACIVSKKMVLMWLIDRLIKIIAI